MENLNAITAVIAFVCSLVAAILTLPWLMRFCYKHKLYDVPNERKVHKNNIPRLGGTIFLPSMVVGCGAAVAVSHLCGMGLQEIHVSTIAIFVGTVLIYLTGMFDDVFGLGARLKFAIQTGAAVIMPVCGLYINDLQGILWMHEIPLLLAYPLTVFLILLVVNSINLIDGIDGLAASLCIVALATYATLFAGVDLWAFAAMCVTLIAALVVFLYFNIWGSCERHTKTFMGDSGSLILGYCLSYLGLKYAMDNGAVIPHQPYSVLATLTVLIIPTFDLTRVAFTRLLQGKPMFDPDKQHIHHRFAAAGFTMRQSLCAIVGLQLLFCATNAVLYMANVNINLTLLVDIIIFTAVQMWLGCRMKHNKDRNKA